MKGKVTYLETLIEISMEVIVFFPYPTKHFPHKGSRDFFSPVALAATLTG